MKLSVIIPVYNEQDTIVQTINQVMESTPQLNKEIIVVNDGSTDDTMQRIENSKYPGLVLINQPKNTGKGAALRAGIQKASGDIIIIQDADLEYTPGDYPALLQPILEDRADVVFGTRLQGGGGPQRVLFFWHYLGNKMLTTLSNIFTNLNLSDMEVGLKVFRSGIIKNIKLRENRFGFEPEITAKVAKLNCRIYEVPISYYGRTYKEGKKIGLKDAFSALRCIIKYALMD